MFTTITAIGAAALVQTPASHASSAGSRNRRTRVAAETAGADTFARTIELIDRAGQTKAANALPPYVTAVWSRLVAWKMRRATRTILASLDDRILQDIGLQRSEIDRALSAMQRRPLHWHV